MRRWLVLLAALVAVSTDGAPGFGRGGGLTTCPKGYVGGGLTPCTPSYAFFEFAPASGAGMGAACACAAVTGAKGEALTMTRASAGTCSKQGPASTGIAVGDLATCGNNLPRIESANGVLSYLREADATNLVLRSEEFDNGAWNKTSSGGPAAPVVTPNYAQSPRNDATADRIQFAAIPGATQESTVYQAGVCPAGTATASVFVQGTTGSGVIQLVINTGAPGTCVACAYNSTSATRCIVSGTVSSSGNMLVSNRTDVYGCAGSSLPAQDVIVWGAQCEAGAFATSYIQTTSAAATRSADSQLTATLTTGIGPNFSEAATVTYLGTGAASVPVQLGSSAPNLAKLGVASNTALDLAINASSTGPTVAAIDSTSHRGSLSDAAGVRSAYWDGVSLLAPAGSMTGMATAVAIGAVGAVTKQVCIDPDPSRCR